MPNQNVSQRLHNDLGRLIASTPPGGRLPSEPALAEKLHVSRATLREAMRTFETQGLIRRKQGSGTYVSHPSAVIDTGLEVLESIERLAERIGLPVTLGDWKLDIRPAQAEEAQALNLSPGAPVIAVVRVILAEGRPVAYLIDILPEDILNPDELSTGFTGSVLDFLARRGSPALRSSRTEINAVTASPEIARSLGIQRGDVLLRLIAYLYAVDGRVIDYSYSYFLPGYFHFHVVRRVG
jgi:GntR family transcriptional regulator